MKVSELTHENLEQRIRVHAQREGTLSGNLGMVVEIPEINAVNLALWREGRCVQLTVPEDTECEVLD